MKMQGFVITISRILCSVLICFLAVALCGGNVFCQEKKVSKTTSVGNTVSVATKTYTEIPEATEPCTPAECEWWKQLRQAGNDLQKKEDEKSKRRFVLLFAEGLEKSYRIPLKDRPPQFLAGESVQIADLMKPMIINGTRVPKRKINGEVVLSVEYRSDGSVGEIKIVKGLDPEVDNRAVQAARQTIFLPAIKNGVFVTHYQDDLKYKFWTGIN